ncbi:MAG: disulfide bond formation protein B [Pseudomonas sp.]|uniref:disulfide bond formation protein B n=1 Tax=Pseudomonas sp. TaxID=306 RepID=UPI003D0E6B15
MNAPPSTSPWGLLVLSWLLALVATLAALFIGEVMGQAPCVLCWFQRAFMFPLAVILAIACYRSDFAVWVYALPLAAIGGVIALVHSLLYSGIIPQRIQPCSASGPSCTDANMTVLGVPLPWLALAVFATLVILLLIIRRRTSA